MVPLFGVALRGVLLEEHSVMDEELGDWGMCNFLRVVGERADGVLEGVGRRKGVGGRRGADSTVVLIRPSGLLVLSAVLPLSFLLWPSDWQEHKLPALEGCEMGVRCPALSVKLKADRRLVLVKGVETAGDSALRKSM